jgi:hypothetical protein
MPRLRPRLIRPSQENTHSITDRSASLSGSPYTRSGQGRYDSPEETAQVHPRNARLYLKVSRQLQSNNHGIDVSVAVLRDIFK